MVDVFNVGDKVTIYSGRGSSQKAVAITVVREVRTRFFLTGDDRRWQTKGIFHNEVNARGTEISRLHAQPYKAGDEAHVVRTQLLDDAKGIFGLERYVGLLDDTDLARLGGIVKRLTALKEARNNSSFASSLPKRSSKLYLRGCANVVPWLDLICDCRVRPDS